MDFVPEPSELEVVPESDKIEIFANQVTLSVEASVYTTAIEVSYLTADGSAWTTTTYIVWQEYDQSMIEIQQTIPDNVVEISLKGLNPKGKSDAVLVEIDRIESVALTGLQGDQVHLSSNRIPVKMVRPHPYGLSLVPDRNQSFYGSHPFSIYDVQIDQIPYGKKIFDSDDDDRFIGSERIHDLFQIQYLTFFLRKPSEFSTPEKAIYMGLEDSNDDQKISAIELLDLQVTPHKLANLDHTKLILASLDSNNNNKLHVVDIASLVSAGQNKQQIDTILNSGLTAGEISLQFGGSNLQSKTIDFLNSSGSMVHLGLSDASRKWVYEITQEQGSIQAELLIFHNPFQQASSLDDSYDSFILDEREFDKITSFHYTDDQYFMSLRKDASSHGGPIYQWSIEPFEENPEMLEGQSPSGYAKLYLRSNEAGHELEETFRKPVDSGAFGTVDMNLTSLGLLRLDSEGNLSMMTQEFLYPVQVNNEYSNRHFNLESFERIATTFREPISMANENLDLESYGLYMLGEEGELYYLDQSVGMVYQATDYDYESITNHPDTYQNEGVNLAATADGRVYELEFSDSSVQRTLLLTIPVGNRELSMIQLEGDYLFAAVDGKLYEYDLNSTSAELILDLSDHQTYGVYKIVGFATTGYASETMLLYLKHKEYDYDEGLVVETTEGESFRTRSFSAQSMSADHNKIYIIEYQKLRELDRLSLRITDTLLDSNQQSWNSFQPVHTKLPASITNYYFSSFLDSSAYAIQEMPGVGTQLRKISNDVIFSDISVTLNPSKTGVLSNGDQITFEVQLLDEFGDAFDEAPVSVL